MLGKTVAEVGRTISPREFGYWMAYYNIEPFGPLQDSQRAGMIAATVANTTPGVKRSYAPVDFFAELEVASAEPEGEEDDEAAQLAIEQREMALARAIMTGLRKRGAVKEQG